MHTFSHTHAQSIGMLVQHTQPFQQAQGAQHTSAQPHYFAAGFEAIVGQPAWTPSAGRCSPAARNTCTISDPSTLDVNVPLKCVCIMLQWKHECTAVRFGRSEISCTHSQPERERERERERHSHRHRQRQRQRQTDRRGHGYTHARTHV